MIFNPKYNHLNNLFGELGYVIGCLGDSSTYSATFIDIADRVVVLNEGGKVDKKSLRQDIDSLFVRLEKEGYCYVRQTNEKVNKKNKIFKSSAKLPSLIIVPFRLLKIYWQLPDTSGRWSVITLSGLLIALFMIIIGCIYGESLEPPSPSWVVPIFGLGVLLSTMFGIATCGITYDAINENLSKIKNRYEESKCQSQNAK